MDTQARSTILHSHHPTPNKTMRSYQVVLKCISQIQREEINQRLRRLEERQRI